MAKRKRPRKHSRKSELKYFRILYMLKKMGIKLLFKGECVIVFYHSTTGVLEMIWFGNIDSTKVKRDGIKLILAVEQEIITKGYKIDKVLNVSQNAKGDFSEISKWILEDWFVRVYNLGVLKFSWAYPTELNARIASEKSTPSKGSMVRGFPDLIDAIRWLSCGEEQSFVSYNIILLHALLANDHFYGIRNIRLTIIVNLSLQIRPVIRRTGNSNEAKIAKVLLCIACLELCETIAAFDEKLREELQQEIMLLRETLRKLGGSGRRITPRLKREALAHFQKFIIKRGKSSQNCVREFARQQLKKIRA